MKKCKICKGNCDNGELVGEVCPECLEEERKKKNRKMWLDKVIDNTRERLSLKFYEKDIILCNSDDYVHVVSGIEVLARAVGKTIIKRKRLDEEYPFEYSFVYRDMRVIQIGKEEGIK